MLSERLKAQVFVFGVVAIILASVGSAIVIPIWQNLTRAWTSGDKARKLLALSEAGPGFRSALSQSEALLNEGRFVYAQPSVELAGALLQNDLQGIVASVGGQIGSSSIATPTKAGGFQVLQIDIALIIPSKGFPNLLAKIDTHLPYLKVRSMDVQTLGGSDADNMLSVQISVNGYGKPQ